MSAVPVGEDRPEGVKAGQLWIEDAGRPEYLDGVEMQFAVKVAGSDATYLDDTVAYCATLELAQMLADAIVAKGLTS